MIQPAAIRDEITAFRGSVYQIFSECILRPPTREILAVFANAEWRESACALLGPEVRNLCTDLAPRQEAEYLAVEHSALFVVPGPQQTFPYETNYREKRVLNGESRPGLRLGRAASEVVKTYQEWGMRADLETDELPDHAGVELRFMSMLVAAEGLAWEAHAEPSAVSLQQAQSGFLDRHVLQWFPQWLQFVHQRARRPFYRSASLVLQGFLETEKVTLNRLLEKNIGGQTDGIRQGNRGPRSIRVPGQRAGNLGRRCPEAGKSALPR
ncbi:MAG: molecular chaperone TorD family protein [Acidobacteria bacterium]|nr:molecular chaperone TorD family protein [Acidobacteriota bacterium]